MEIVKKYGPTLFLDADMLLLRGIDEFTEINKHDMSVTIRPESTLKVKLHEDHKKKFPRLINKTFGEVIYNNKVLTTNLNFQIDKGHVVQKGVLNFKDNKPYGYKGTFDFKNFNLNQWEDKFGVVDADLYISANNILSESFDFSYNLTLSKLIIGQTTLNNLSFDGDYEFETLTGRKGLLDFGNTTEETVGSANDTAGGLNQKDIGINGHSIEARIYAENPSNGFLPATGVLSKWQCPSGPGIRLDSGFREGDEITIDFDPMLAKLIVHAPNRKAALRKLDTALSDFIILGVITNLGFLRDIIKQNRFSEGRMTTDYLDNADNSIFIQPTIDPSHLIVIASAAERLGINTKSSSSINDGIMDNYSGHVGDPFKTLSRIFP